jgi:branched-chain amino acid transport system ATP-binding protein
MSGVNGAPMLEIHDLHVSYGRVDAVRGVSLSLAHGQIVTVIGPNGAGKTTMLGAAMGLLPSSGTLRFDGEDLHALDVEARVERGLCLVPERRELFGELTVLDNLVLGAYSRRLSRATLKHRLDAVYARFERLAERRAQRADTLSGGERQMLALGRALMSAPRLLMLDEPSLGLSPIMANQVFEALGKLKERGQTILLVEQNARRALASTDYAYVIEQGRIVQEGESAALADDPRIISHYLPKQDQPDQDIENLEKETT